MIYYELPTEEFIWIRRIMIHTLTLFHSKEEWEKAKKLGSLLEKFLPPLFDRDGNPIKKDTQWIAQKHLLLADSYSESGIVAEAIFHPKCRKHILDKETYRFVTYIGKIENGKMKWEKEDV